MFYIIEIQQNAEGAGAMLTQTAEEKDQALSIFHGILQYAAISTLEYHSCVVLDEQGRHIARECFRHHSDVTESTSTEEA